MKEMSTMEARLQKWGNSNGIRIPFNILKTLDINTYGPVELYVQVIHIIFILSLII